ncbi:MAG: dynamin family protein, partial [Planctomycetota bacterium]|nr:dynamin family protein [Planctomycetota bacterium]
MAEGRPFNLDQARADIERLYKVLSEMFQTIVEDHQKLRVCRGYSDYQASMPKSFLDKARFRLDRKTYKVGFAGAFSSGKSTLINALFGAPDMLPTEAGECTMSITLVGPPPPGQEEHVEVKYFTREDAVRFVLTNERYRQLFAPIKEKLMADFDVEKALAAIRDAISKMTCLLYT